MSRHRTRAEERIEALDTSPDAAGSTATGVHPEIERLRSELEAARRSADEYLAALQRERAEFVNFRRRTSEEREATLGLAAESLLSKVLAVADDFDLAIDARPGTIAADPWMEGIGAIDRKLRQVLESEGVRPIDAAPGQPFDPRLHEAIANVPGSGQPEGAIVSEIRRGYRLRDRVLRPALVTVAAESPGAERPNGGAEPDTHPEPRTH
jgi:molecular chaperone GrpE